MVRKMSDADYVILVHGLGRTHLSLALPWLRLRSAGFEPLSIRYPSRARPIQGLAHFLRNQLPMDTDRKIHFLTHSLGGLIVRYLIRVARPPDLGRVVMLSPPNQGSQLARLLGKNWFYRLATGPAGQQVASNPEELSGLLGPVNFDLGVITGRRPLNPLTLLLPKPNDGKVTVEETRVSGMADFLVVPRGHTFIMNDHTVIEQVVHFLKQGRFARQKEARMPA